MLWHRNDRGRSPDKGSSWSDRFKTVNRDRSRSRSPDRGALPQHSQGSFHKAMMERGGWDSDRNKSFHRDRSRSPSPHRQERAPAVGNSFHRSMIGQGQSSRARSPNRNSPSSLVGGRSNNSPPKEWGGSVGDGRYGGEEEEGMIPEEEGMIGHDDPIHLSAN